MSRFPYLRSLKMDSHRFSKIRSDRYSTEKGPKIVIIGAGPAGLGAAYRLQEIGYKNWEIYERNPYHGGLASSHRNGKGFIWGVGAHAIYSHYDYIDKLLDKLLGDDFILVHAVPNLPPLKFGYFNPHGWMGYWIDDLLVIKHIDARADARYPDHGCNVESYCNDAFIELESLGELVMVAPGQIARHNELWELHDSLDVPFIPDDIKKAMTTLIR